MKQPPELTSRAIQRKRTFEFSTNNTHIISENISPAKDLLIRTSTSTTLSINVFLISKSVEVIRALKHNLRRRIISFIHSKGSTCVTDLYIALGLTQSDASQHLRILRNAGVVQTRREQKQVFYSVNYERLKEIDLHIKNFVG